ncbi:MAG: glycosyltransferase [Pseudonocardiaceae bacterium]
MIVKNEAPVIERCLSSVRPLIDSWLIVDTGSVDNTQGIVRDCLGELPGELVERPWVNFAHNRTEALRLAKGRADYVLVIDADETLEQDDGFRIPDLTADAYYIEMRYGGCSYLRKQLLRDGLPWRYVGVVHEYLDCGEAHSEEMLSGLRTVVRHDGARARDQETYRRDALALEAAIADEPDNARYVFYLAQSYRDAGDLAMAIRTYSRRAEMGGWNQEVWFSLYQVAQLGERLDRSWPEVMQDYLTAYNFQPDRAEPLFRIGMHYQNRGEHAIAHIFLSRAAAIPRPRRDNLFVELPVYDYMAALEHAVSAYYVGDHATAIATNNELLRSASLPPHGIDQVIANRRFSLDAQHKPHNGNPTAPVVIIIPSGQPRALFDEAVDSVLHQDEPVEGVILDDGSLAGGNSRLPAPGNLRVIAGTPGASWNAALRVLLDTECRPEDVVLPLPPGQSLAASDVVRRVQAAFIDPRCRLLYAPYRQADGRLSGAEPAPGPATFAERGLELTDGSPLAFRVSLWRDTPECPEDVGVRDAAMWRAAAFAGTRFADEPLTAKIITSPGAQRCTTRPPQKPVAEMLPLVSCLMVTGDRLPLAKRSIRCFAEQTYTQRELVIVTQDDGYQRALKNYVEEEGIVGVRFVDAPSGLPLGRLRNISLDAAAGTIVCQWDDDDCHHHERLAMQAGELSRADTKACLLTDHLQFFRKHRVLAWIDWTLGGQITDEYRFFPGTLMMRADTRFRYPESGPHARRGEDSVLLSALWRNASVAGLSGVGYLYLYEFHGANTFPREHHQRTLSCCAPEKVVLPFKEQIRKAALRYPIPKPLTVIGADGPLFAVR